MIGGYTNRLQSATENLASSATPGYKRSNSEQPSFDAIMKETDAVRSATGSTIDFTSGPLRPTERPLDFAIQGNAFFVVGNDNSDYYTRNGSFRADPNGQLVTLAGLTIKGANGSNITVPSNIDMSTLVVDPDGTLRAGKQHLGQFRIASFSNPGDLERAGPSLFSASPNAKPATTDGSQVINGHLEASNTCVFEEMAELITSVRGFEACQKILTMEDRAEEKMIKELS